MPLAQSQGKLLSGSERSTEVWEEVRTRDLAGNDVMIGSIAHAEGLACGEHPTVPPCVMIGLRESTALNKGSRASFPRVRLLCFDIANAIR